MNNTLRHLFESRSSTCLLYQKIYGQPQVNSISKELHIRLRRQFFIYERDWRRLPLLFDYEIEEQPEFLERRKLAKQLCWHWLQLELNCTYRASTIQELDSYSEDAQVLWLNDQLVDDQRITYYLGKDKFDPQCVEEIF